MMEMGLLGKVAFVAGSSRGIGLEIARAFLQEGALVVISGRDRASLEKARAALEAQAGSQNVLSVPGDMTRVEEIHRALDMTVEICGGLDAVVANVGSGTARGGLELSPDDWQSALDTNLVGSMLLAGEAIPYLINRSGGSITFVSSIVGIEATTAPLTYSAAKAGLLNAMKNLSRLAAPHNVRVNAVAPGNILFPGGSWERKLAEQREFYKEYIESEVPLKRFGRPEEIADAVVFLASERASFITGACLVVDGGQTHSL